MDNYYSSRVMEYTWHILFGEPPTARALEELSINFCDMSSSDQTAEIEATREHSVVKKTLAPRLLSETCLKNC